MDSFEAVVAAILQRQGYWTQISVKVELTPAEKRAINRPSSPRWELDVVAYSGKTNKLLVIECKSYLDSSGVHCATFEGDTHKDADRFKLFFDLSLRQTVLGRLVAQYEALGFCAARPDLKFGLAAGKVAGDETRLQKSLEKKEFYFLGPTRLREELAKLGAPEFGYENSVAATVAKILLRTGKTSTTKD